MRNRRRKEKYRVLIIILLMISLGYAFLSTTLNIMGTATIKSNTWNIYWDSNSVDIVENSVTGNVDVSEDGQIITYDASLNELGDYFEFTIDAVNEGTIDGMLSIENMLPVVKNEDGEVVGLPSYIKYSMTYADGNQIETNHKLGKRVDQNTPTRETYRIKIELDEDIEEELLPQEPLLLKIENEVPYTQANSDAVEREKKDLKTLTVTFDPKGGSVNPTTKEVKEEGRYGILPTPEREGYTFDGWYFENKRIKSNTVVKITQDETFEAKWIAVDYTITYELNGGENNEDNPGGYNASNDDITLKAPTKSGYTFTGWTGSNGDTPETNVTIPSGSIGDKEYEAHWSKDTYTITYILGGGENHSNNPTTYQVDSDDIVILSPTKTGYTFEGWTTGEVTTPERSITIEKGSTGNIELTAHWTTNTYTISYELNGGENNPLNPTSYDVETETITLLDPTKTGYTFEGWTTEEVTTPTKAIQIEKGSTGNKSYTANWSKDTYTISYTMNGGENNPSNPSSYQVDTETITLVNPTKLGYTFTGWTTEGVTTPTKDLQITKGSTGNKSYTANWSKDTYTITYNLDGGENNPLNPTTYQVDTETITLLDPTKSGYTFEGWTTEGVTTPTKALQITKGSTGNKSYTANWSKDTYSISYTLNNGTNNSNNPTTYQVDTNTITLQNPTKVLTFNADTNGTGATIENNNRTAIQTFKGWTGSNGTTAQTSVTIEKGSTGAKSYTAHWSAVAGTLPKVSKTGYSCGFATSNTATTKEYDSEGTFPASAITESMNTTVNLYAVCSRETYTISYTLNGGENNSNNPTSYHVESNDITLQAPTRSGYTFTGWTGSNGTTAQTSVTIAKGSTGNKTYTANWSKDTYSISYTLNGGTNNSNNPTTYQVDTDTITLGDASKSGWTFTGWTGNGTTTPTKSLTLPNGSTGDKTYTAHFEKQITLTQKHGSSTTTQSYTLTDSETSHTFTLVTSKDSFSGWTFEGWLDDGTPKAPDYGKTANITISSDKTVYATYSQALKATFIDYNGTSKQTREVTGTAYGNNTCGGVINQYPTVTSPAQSTYTGWSSGGWTTATASDATSSLASSTNFVLQSNQTYYGIYSQGVTLTYAANGGSSTPSTQTGTRKTNSYAISTYSNPTFTLAAAISRDYYTFAGWSVSAPISAVKAASSTITPASGTALTATASWTAVSYSISYSLNNGTNNSNNPSSYTVESSAITLQTPSKTLTFKGNTNSTSGAYGTGVTIGSNTTKAQTFAGWTGSNGTTKQTSVTIAAGSHENKSYTAHWTAVAGTLPTVTKSNYQCGWSTSSTGTTIQYASGGTFPTSAITESMNATVNLYAVCIPKYTVTFNPNGGSVSPTSTTVLSGNTIGTLPTPTRTGYIFLGWYTGLTDGTQISSSYKPTSTQSVYAHWRQITAADVSYTKNGQTTVDGALDTLFNMFK